MVYKKDIINIINKYINYFDPKNYLTKIPDEDINNILINPTMLWRVKDKIKDGSIQDTFLKAIINVDKYKVTKEFKMVNKEKTIGLDNVSLKPLIKRRSLHLIKDEMDYH